MAVTKRVRFEILRRDSNTCQYCGQMAPDVPLHIDHVIPLTLGGSDDPSNLVTACKDCNGGKASISPDSPLVQQVSNISASYAVGLRAALEQRSAELDAAADVWDGFLDLWRYYVPEFRRSSWTLPADARESVLRWHAMGVGLTIFEYAISVAIGKKDVDGSGKFTYTAGVIWNIVRAAEERAKLASETQVEAI